MPSRADSAVCWPTDLDATGAYKGGVERSPKLHRILSPFLTALLAAACYAGSSEEGGDAPGPGDGGDGVGDDGSTGDDGGGTGDGGGGDDGGGDDGGDGNTGDDGGNTGGDGGTTDEPQPDPDPEVPDTPHCQPAANWQASWSQWEQEVLDLVNQRRAQGANCGSQGSFGATGPLTMHAILRCAARLHSKDMNDRSFFDHTNPSGEGPGDRAGQAGYNTGWVGENIATGQPSPAEVMNGWMQSDGHCSNIMNPDYRDLGVGYYPGGQWGHLWTQVFGTG